MKKLWKYTLRFLAGIFILLVVVTLTGWIYIKTHKATLLAYIQTASAKQLNGEIVVGDISASLFHTFPRMAITLKDVNVHDSLWKDHEHDLLKADRIFATLNMLSLLTGKLRIERILLEGATINLYTDSNGYSNTSIFKKHPETTPKTSGPPPYYPIVEIKESKFIMEKADKHKLFRFDIQKLLARVSFPEDNGTLHLNVLLSVFSHGLGFNQANGAFVLDKPITGNFPIEFNTRTKIMQFENILLAVDDQPIRFTGKFMLAEVPTPFTLSVTTENLPYKKAASFVSQNIRRKLDQYDIDQPITSLYCVLDNSDPNFNTPLIHLTLHVKDRNITTPVASFEAAGFTGSYTNEVIKGMGHGDDNSVLRFSSFYGLWQGMHMHADSISIYDLVHPRVVCHLNTRISLVNANNLLDDKTLEFTGGHARIDLLYRGSLDSTIIQRDIVGSILLDTASLNYLPRNFSMTDCNGIIRFNHQDMYIDDLHANTGSSDLFMNGGVKSLFSIIDKNAPILSLNWNIQSAKINLADFNGFLKKRTTQVVKKKQKVLFGETISKITNLLESCSMQLTLQSKKLVYKKFYATNLKAAVSLTNDAIELNQVQLEHADGTLSASGSIKNLPSSNPMRFQAKLNKVNVSKMLTGFGNFGQTAITDQNLKGILSADIKLKGIISDKAAMINDSTTGTIDFSLTDGQLIKFEPVEKISKTVFKKRDFSDIQFGNLKDKFDITGNNITINRMEIQSTVLSMFVEGTYNMKKGADLSIQVPLSNLKGANSDSLLTNKGVDSKTGISARLRAKTGDDGKLKISWDPFKKAVRKMHKKE